MLRFRAEACVARQASTLTGTRPQRKYVTMFRSMEAAVAGQL